LEPHSLKVTGVLRQQAAHRARAHDPVLSYERKPICHAQRAATSETPATTQGATTTAATWVFPNTKLAGKK
jgi:hypothetical protein